MASEQQSNAAAPALDAPPATLGLDDAIEHAKRAFALKKYEQAVDYYATALELITEKHGDDAPETADLYLVYGKALLENAISQATVLGKEQPDDGQEEDGTAAQAAGGSGAILSFSGDAEDADEGREGEEGTVDLFAQALREAQETEADGEEEEDDEEDAEPEDDFNAAWEVLDLARAIFDKQKDEDDEVKLKLAETYITLGDVSLETEKFDQAINDYTAGLAIKTELLPISSRQIAEAHYKLSMVLDLTPGRLADAIVHSEKALESVETRLAELRDGANGQLKPLEPSETKVDAKGKGKAKPKVLEKDIVQNMSKAQIEAEIKEVEGLRDDLALKVEELKTTPNEPEGASAPALAAQALDNELNNSATSSTPAQPVVNDLTSMVVKKKKKADANGTAKRKADEEPASPSAKKAKVEEATDS